MRTAIRPLMILALLLAMAAPVRADGPVLPAVVRVEAGFDGLAKAGKWVPVAVTLKNEGAEFTGELRFASKSQFGPTPQTNIYRTAVVIPAGGTKRVQLHVPLEMGSPPALTLAPKAGGDSLTVDVKLQTSSDMLVGVLGVEPAELKALAGMQNGAQAVRLVRLDPATMPTDALELANLDALLLDRFVWTELPEPQRQAVQAWVEYGGTLIAAGGPEGKRLEGLAPWAPLTVQGVQSTAVDGVGAAPLTQFALKEGGWRVTRQAGSLPLTARLPKGAGMIHLLAFDPALEPFASWSGLPKLFEGVLPAPLTNAGMGGQQGVAMKAQWVLMDVLNNFPVAQIPASKGLLWILAAYAVVIGPVHFLLLRGFRRLGWALLSLPLLASIGAGGAWAYAQEAKRSDVMVNAISVIQGQADGRFLKVNSLAGIHMPPRSTHAIRIGDALLQGMAPPPQPGPNGMIEHTALDTTVDDGRSVNLAPLDEWQMRGVAAEGLMAVPGTISAAVQLNGLSAEGRLTSHLPFALKDAIIASGSAFTKIGDLKPGDAVDVSLLLPAVTPDFGGPMLGDVINRAYQFQGFGPEGPTQGQRELMIRQQMGWAAINAIGMADAGNQPSLMLVGWTDQAPLPVSVDGRATDVSAIGVYVQPLPVSFGRGALTVPSSFVGGRMVELNGQTPPQGMMRGWNLPKDGTAIVDFEMPDGLAARIDEVQAKLPVATKGPAGSNPVSIAYYRWTDGTWAEPGTENGSAKPAPGAGFVSAGGTVRIRIRLVTGDPVALGVPGLTVHAGEAQP